MSDRYLRLLLAAALSAGAIFAPGANRAAAGDEPPQLQWARRLVAEVAPSENAYAWSPTFVVWSEDGRGPARNRSVCSSFVSHDLERAFGFGAPELQRRFGLANPQAKDYYDAIVAQRGFQNIGRLAEVRPGDIIAVRYPAGSHPTGHVMMVDSLPRPREASAPRVRGTQQYDLTVIDSSHSYHGFEDTRYVRGGKHGGGVGRGTLRVYVRPDGALAGYAWSTRDVSVFRSQDERTMAFGRFEPDFTGTAALTATETHDDETDDDAN